MKIQNLRVVAYGRHKDRALSFGDDGVQMIVGANEAGKSTLLEFIRELLFGFADRDHKYAFGTAANGRMEGRASLVLNDGAVVELTRRKGRKNTVSGSVDGREGALDEEAFEAMLGGASEGLFRSVFAFGLEELVAGEKTLADQSVRSVLFSAGAAASADPRKVLESLEAESGKLYGDAARTREINKALAELTGLTREMKEKSERCDDYEKRRRELEEAEAGAARLDVELREAARALARRERLAKALSPWRQLVGLRRCRSELHAPAGFPADGLERFNALEKEAASQTTERDKNRDAAAKAERGRNALRFDPRLIERRAAVEPLAQSITSAREARRDLPAVRRDRTERLRRISERLAELTPDWTLDDFRERRVSAEDRDRLERLIADREARDRKRDALAGDRERHEEKRLDEQSALAALDEPEDVAPLTARIAGFEARQADQADLERRRKDHAALQREADGLLRRLPLPGFVATLDAASLPAPSREAVARFKQEFDRIGKRIATAESRLAADETEAETLARELAVRVGDLPDRDALAALRRDRDEGWALVVRKFVDREDAESAIRDWLAARGPGVADLLAAYPALVARADAHADDLFLHAGDVVRAENLADLRERVARDAAALDDLRADDARLVSEWRSLWSACGLVPLDPDAMTAWLASLEALRSVREKLAENEQEGRRVADRIASFDARLAEAVGRDGPAEELIVVARRREQAARDDETARARHVEELRKLGEKIARVDRGCETLRAESKEADVRVAALLRDLRLPESWELDLLVRVLDDLDRLRPDLRLADDCDGRITAHEVKLADFDREVAALVAEVAPDLADFEPERAAEELHERITASVTARASLEGLEKTIADALADVEDRERRLASLAAEREELFRLAGVETAEEFRAVAGRAAEIARLEVEIEAGLREFDAIRDGDPLDEFAAALEESDAVSLEAAREEASARHDRLRREKSTADQEIGSLRRAFSEHERGGAEAAGLLEKAASGRAKLADAIDRYVPLVFAQHLLKKALARFEREARPRMLDETSRLFAMMTDDRYVRVDRPEDDEGPLLVHRHDGEELGPHQLSVGTREQLYLAVRLAYVLHYCERAEPLPIVMDDVLANFDDARSRRTLRALGDVSRKAQVIFLTCHDHVVQLGREVFPAIRVQDLSAPTEADASEPPPKGARKRRRATLPDPLSAD